MKAGGEYVSVSTQKGYKKKLLLPRRQGIRKNRDIARQSLYAAMFKWRV